MYLSHSMLFWNVRFLFYFFFFQTECEHTLDWTPQLTPSRLCNLCLANVQASMSKCLCFKCYDCMYEYAHIICTVRLYICGKDWVSAVDAEKARLQVSNVNNFSYISTATSEVWSIFPLICTPTYKYTHYSTTNINMHIHNCCQHLVTHGRTQLILFFSCHFKWSFIVFKCSAYAHFITTV